MTLGESLLLLWRGIRLRCPRCGRGKLFRRGLSMHERCAYCGWVFEREEGYWTGAIAVNLVVAELLITAFAIPAAVLIGLGRVAVLPVVLIGVPATIALPLLFYRHSKSLWMTLDFMIHPVPLHDRAP